MATNVEELNPSLEENTAPNLPALVTRKPQPKEIHRQAFDYYLSLGENRALIRVAERFNKTPQEIGRWSKLFGWKERITEKESMTIQEQILEKTDRFFSIQIDILLMRQAEMVEPDPDEPAKLVLTDKATISALKELTNSAFSILKAIAEKVGIKNAEKEDGEGGNRRGVKTGVMVNVIFKGKGAR